MAQSGHKISYGMHRCLPFIKCVPVYVTPWGYKRLSVHIKDCSRKKMNGTLYPKENGCNNRVVVLTRSSCEGAPLYYICDPCTTCQTRYLFRWGLWCSQVMFLIFKFISVTSSRYMTDFIRPFYSCMLKTVVSECTESRMWVPLFTEPSLSLMCIWTLFTFEKKWSFYWNKVTFSLTSAQGQGTQHPTVKLPLRVFTKKKAIHFALVDSFDFFKKPYIQCVSVECRSK